MKLRSLFEVWAVSREGDVLIACKPIVDVKVWLLYKTYKYASAKYSHDSLFSAKASAHEVPI